MRDDIELNLIELLVALTILGMVAVVGTAIIARYYYDGLDHRSEFHVYPVLRSQPGTSVANPERNLGATDSFVEPMYSSPTPFYEFDYPTASTAADPIQFDFGDLDEPPP